MAFTLHHANNCDNPSIGNDYFFSNSSNNLTSLSKSISSDNSSLKQKKNISHHKTEKFFQQQLNNIYINTSKRSNNAAQKKTKEISIRNRRCYKAKDSSELSSNLTCSEIETVSNTTNSDSRVQRKKFIKCILKEDTNMMKTSFVNYDLKNIRDKNKNNFMHIACGFGRLKSVQTLLKLCPDLINLADNRGHNPIDVAIKHGQKEIINWFLTKTNVMNLGYSQIDQIHDRSYIHFAAKHGENEILRIILSEMYKLNISLDTKDFNGNTAAHLAAKYNHLDCLQTLVEYNCDITIVNINGHTPCFIAEYYHHKECVHYLMIVETCINLSIKVVKISRKLRETKSNNDILKAQMDEAIAINNDFINQRENYMNISLELMQRQLDELGSKMVQEIKFLQSENQNIKVTIHQLKKNEKNKEPSKKYQNTDEIITLKNLDIKSNNNDHIKNDLYTCQQEMNNTKINCNKVLKLDRKKMENIKTRFDEIKININLSNEDNQKCYLFNCDSSDIIESREHFEILRKIYQETTHKLMIFRNALKEKQYLSVKNFDHQDNNLPDIIGTEISYRKQKDQVIKSTKNEREESTFDMINCPTEMYEKQVELYLHNQSVESSQNELIYNESSEEDFVFENSTKDDIDELAVYGFNSVFNETNECNDNDKY